jgi:16S rRNA (uracil1498-N3)-methyltransferase
MRLHRFYVSQKIGEQKELTIDSAELVNQVRRVFRLKEGDSIVLFDGSGKDYVCTIDNYSEQSKIEIDSVIRLRVTETVPSRYTPNHKLYLCAAVVKKDTFEWIVEKATELGVTDIIPIMAERSEKKSLNEGRLLKIATEASEQSGRGATPMVHQIMGPADAAAFLKSLEKDIQMIAFHTEGEQFKRGEFELGKAPLGVFIGPEGGWSPSELEMFHGENIPIRCLGPQVLRAETAVIASLSQVVFSN